MRVLIVEDDPILSAGLQEALAGVGHDTVCLGDGLAADLLLGHEHFDLVVLDLGLPSMSGTLVLKRLRARHQSLPVLILSARDRTEDRVQGLDAGADDYLGKPFELSEFEARVRALLRRAQGQGLALGRLQWSFEHHQGEVGGESLSLSRGEVSVLEALLRAPGRIIAKETIARRIGPEVPSSDNMVEVYIHRLRRKLADAGVEIRTVRGLGYLMREAGE